jgi:phage terminase large subunit GpA-like protein
MFKLRCPKCHKDSYSSDQEFYAPCPYCGHIFSGKHGSDRRKEERTAKKISFSFPHNEQSLQSNTKDLSNNGLCVEIFGESSITTGDDVNLSIGDTRFNARVVWKKTQPDKSLVGLQKII